MPLVERYSKAVYTEFKLVIKPQVVTDNNLFHTTSKDSGSTTPSKFEESTKHETLNNSFEGVLKSCNQFDGGAWGEFKSTANFFNPIAWVAKILRLFSSRNVGGSTMACSSSGVRAKNIKENLRIVAEWIGRFTPDKGSIVFGHQHYRKIDRKEEFSLTENIIVVKLCLRLQRSLSI